LPTITSLHNERVKLVHALQSQGKVRRQEKRIALEGVRLIGDALAAGVRPDFVFFTPESSAGDQPVARLLARLRDQGVLCIDVTPEVMAHVTDTESTQGIVAVVPMPELPVPAHADLVLILDGIADPGNLGTILRTAAAAGAGRVVLAPHCVDPFNPKVLRSGMGAHFRVPITRQSWEEIAGAVSGLSVYLADPGGTIPYYGVDWRSPSALIVGGEAHGADPHARQLAGTTVSIPMGSGVESLNAASAAAVILFEIRRQRTASQPIPPRSP
jgi:TrmH family RNA methyltransferase